MQCLSPTIPFPTKLISLFEFAMKVHDLTYMNFYDFNQTEILCKTKKYVSLRCPIRRSRQFTNQFRGTILPG